MKVKVGCNIPDPENEGAELRYEQGQEIDASDPGFAKLEEAGLLEPEGEE